MINEKHSYAKILSEHTLALFDRQGEKISIWQFAKINLTTTLVKTAQIALFELKNSVSDKSAMLVKSLYLPI